ncbi:tyrosine-type recombinase/integrase [Bradyrhizobium sp. CW7]|uniref:tyrosine-type recombinase/integrase n=1 Tax=Bradyrhizobium sp. CW7 TaxID=2782688 RepID=UPI001FF98EB1|nr:tyrosine-type recombinase/integrase [Bradyrhizobium sp. CW7]
MPPSIRRPSVKSAGVIVRRKSRLRWITIPKSKIGEPRGVPIHEAIVPLLTDMVENRPGKFVRTWEGAPFTVDDDNGGQMKKAIAAARLRPPDLRRGPYTGRHSVSTQLVVNGVHPSIKDQIMGHKADDMSRLYTSVPQTKLIEAINTLPTFRLARRRLDEVAGRTDPPPVRRP